MKRLLVEIGVILSFCVLLGVLGKMWQMEKTERIRTERNQNTLLTGIQHYVTKDSMNAVKIGQLELDKKEIKEYEAGLLEKIDRMGIKLRRLESFTQIGTETNVQFTAQRKDSTVYIPGKDTVIYLKCLEYKEDPWINFAGCYDQNELFTGSIRVKDSLDIGASRVPKLFLGFIKYGVKSIDIDIVNYNPYSTITYARNIKLKR